MSDDFQIAGVNISSPVEVEDVNIETPISLARGEKGITGEQGVQGEPGAGLESLEPRVAALEESTDGLVNGASILDFYRLARD